MKEEWFNCACYTPEHTMRVMHDTEDHELYVHVFLDERPWWKRIWYGLRYICGYKSRYGHWGEIILRDDDVVRLHRLVSGVIEARHK